MKRILYIAYQYRAEMVVLIIEMITLCKFGNWKEMIGGNILSILFYLIYNIALYNLHFFHQPRDCELLYIYKNQILTESVYVNNKKNRKKLREEFDTIIKYAHENGYSYVYMNTNEAILQNIFVYIGWRRSTYLKWKKELSINQKVKIKSKIGDIVVFRKSDGINVCARYEYRRLMKFHQFRNTMKKMKLFKVWIYF